MQGKRKHWTFPVFPATLFGEYMFYLFHWFFPSISPIKVQHKLIIVNLNEIVHCISKPFVLITILHFNFCVHVFMENNKLNWKKLTDDLDNMMNAFYLEKI